MKKISTLLLFTVLSFTVLLFNCCKKSGTTKVSPSNPNALTSVLVIPNAVSVNSAILPTPSPSTVAPVVTTIDNNISYSSGSQIVLPVTVVSPTHSNIKGVYIQVKGSSTYFDLPINSASSNALISLPINLPSVLGPGVFTLILEFYDYAGHISVIYEVTITITDPLNCGVTKVSGGQGLSSNIFTLSNTAGSVKINYDTYIVPDKIDVFQGGNWIAGTGSSTNRNTLRRPLNCGAATVALGYVGKQGEFNFNYDPSLGKTIEVVVSGCENGGTAWQYTFSCPEKLPPGSASFNFNGTNYSGPCTSVPATQCGSGIDVVISSIDLSGSYFIIYNMPQSASGTFSFTNGWSGPGTCNLFEATSITAGTGATTASRSGTITKTGTNSFTFTCINYDINHNNNNYSVTGSGNY